ncbi:MAG: hypothetical protein EP319_00935 [Deltaproteobacteria bacterium]|nr:MAG: hypothetical protein EP319_00935 [Deltaproteobacteria bacterium]
MNSFSHFGQVESRCQEQQEESSFNLDEVHSHQAVGMYLSSGEGINDPGLQFQRTLKKYPKTKSFLWYSGTALSFDEKDAKSKHKCKALASNTGEIEGKHCGLSGLLESAKQQGATVQIGFESNKFEDGKIKNLDVTQLAKELEDPNSEVRKNVISYAKKLKESGAAIVLRPLSEMNDKGMAWNIQTHKKIDDFAKSWKLMKKIFDEEGAENVKFSFNPIDYGYRPSSVYSVKQLIRKIGPENIDIAGLNIYPTSEYSVPTPLKDSVVRWKRIYKAEGLGNKPFMIGESNVLGNKHSSQQIKDKQKGKWMKDALEYFESVNSNSNLEDDIQNFTIFNGFEKGGKYAIHENSPSDNAIDSHLQ